MGQKYIWQHKEWPKLTWDSSQIISDLAQARLKQGRLLSLAKDLQLVDTAEALINETIMTSTIEGENLNRQSVKSSVSRKLGLSTIGVQKQDRLIEGLVEMLLDATQNYDKPLTEQRLFGWQAALFPTSYSGIYKIQVGDWRTNQEPMQVVSGPMGREKIHFEAPDSKKIEKEMSAFLKWFKNGDTTTDGLVRAAVAHFWFITIHPFSDGNGRIARAITDMALAQDEKNKFRLYSLSSQINNLRDEYYDVLEKCQKNDCDITNWIKWFLKIYSQSIDHSESMISHTLKVSQFWKRNQNIELNSRQRKVIQKVLEHGPQGFEGGLTNRKYVSLTKTSRESAKRDLADLEDKKIIIRLGSAGRSVSYRLNL